MVEMNCTSAPVVRRTFWVGPLLALALAAGCTVGPNYATPKGQLPAAWAGPIPQGAAQTAASADAALAQWWTVFGDATLTSLIRRAVASNLDLQLAESRIRQARASRGIAVAALGPTVNLTGSVTRSKAPGTDNGPGGAVEGKISNMWQDGFDAAWEADVFGGARRGVEAATANVQSAIASRDDVLVTLVAEVAVDYMDLRSFQARIAVAQDNLKAQQHTSDITQQRFMGGQGFASALDVANAKAQVATTTAQIPLLESSAQQTIYALSILLGEAPGALVEELSQARPIPVAPPAVPVGVPSDLLRRRPDVRAAEANIHAATAEIGVATADLYPRFNLTAGGGFQGNHAEALTDWISRFWSIGSSASWQIFSSGAVTSNIEVQKALQDQSVITYRQTVLAGLQEVENALIASTKDQERRAALEDAVASNRKAVELSTELYTEGLSDFLNVLQAQGALFSTQDALTQSDQAVSEDLVALYKALGGGWRAPQQAAGK